MTAGEVEEYLDVDRDVDPTEDQIEEHLHEEEAARRVREAEYPRSWRRHGAPQPQVDAVKLRFLQRVHRDHVPGMFDDPVPFRAAYSSLTQDCHRSEATLALIVMMLADIGESSDIEQETTTTDVAPMVDQLVDDLVLAPSAPPLGRVAAIAA